MLSFNVVVAHGRFDLPRERPGENVTAFSPGAIKTIACKSTVFSENKTETKTVLEKRSEKDARIETRSGGSHQKLVTGSHSSRGISFLLFQDETDTMHSLFVKADRLSGEVIDAATLVHRIIGPGLLESIYERCLMRELELRGVPVLNQEEVVIDYKGTVFKEKLKFDLLADRCLLVELKSIHDGLPIHKAQLLSDMKLVNVPLGLCCSTSMRSSSLTESQGLSCPVQSNFEQKETKTTKYESRT